MGNHEEMMLGARGGKSDFDFWMACGGIATLDSYGSTGQISLVPRNHLAFLERLRPYHETETHFFVHANYAPNLPLDKQSSETLFWRPFAIPSGPHFSGKIAIAGHTPQKIRAIWDLGYAKCIDTGCGHGGLLMALDVGSGPIRQVDEKGQSCVPTPKE
jgi:serine/threonine protein phosphatase 1